VFGEAEDGDGGADLVLGGRGIGAARLHGAPEDREGFAAGKEEFVVEGVERGGGGSGHVSPLKRPAQGRVGRW